MKHRRRVSVNVLPSTGWLYQVDSVYVQSWSGRNSITWWGDSAKHTEEKRDITNVTFRSRRPTIDVALLCTLIIWLALCSHERPVTWTWPDWAGRELTVNWVDLTWPWADYEPTVTWPWADRDLTMTGSWADHDLIVSWPCPDRDLNWPDLDVLLGVPITWIKL